VIPFPKFNWGNSNSLAAYKQDENTFTNTSGCTRRCCDIPLPNPVNLTASPKQALPHWTRPSESAYHSEVLLETLSWTACTGQHWWASLGAHEDLLSHCHWSQQKRSCWTRGAALFWSALGHVHHLVCQLSENSAETKAQAHVKGLNSELVL